MATPITSSARKPHNKNNSSPISTPIFKSLKKINWKNRLTSTRTPLRFTGKNPTPPSSAAAPHTPLFDSTTKKVTLLDWWVIKVQVKGPNHFKFGVGGNAFDGQASTFFSSGEIVKRHDEVTLETVNGITITLASLLNRSRTLENGLPFQVCDHFFLGFPFDWEEFGAQYFGEQSIHGGRSSEAARMSPEDIDDPECLLSSLDDIPVTRLFEHMMVSSGDYNKCPLTRSVFNHILCEYGSSSAKLCEEGTNQTRAEDSLPNETRTPLHVSEENNKPLVAKRCSLDKALKDQLGGKDDNVILDDMPTGTTDNFPTIHSQSKMDEDVHNLSNFVLTRSKTRSQALKNNQQEVLPLNTSMYPDTTPMTSAKQYGDTKTDVAGKDASSSHVTKKISEVNNRILDRPGVRRSSRKKKL
ncbi:SANTA domain-containing protein [Heracleum sosnowskyi]|uniref:SANTA domain-containing protein n=1 Tax=Heracleum sosnowskyi TaxID=360622 RepID=A0AAD8M8U7_9APIA|nr:SANTA domain-containing protein [Heracleum sosnowskyi]